MGLDEQVAMSLPPERHVVTNKPNHSGTSAKGAPANEYERTARQTDAKLAKHKASEESAKGRPETKAQKRP